MAYADTKTAIREVHTANAAGLLDSIVITVVALDFVRFGRRRVHCLVIVVSIRFRILYAAFAFGASVNISISESEDKHAIDMGSRSQDL